MNVCVYISPLCNGMQVRSKVRPWVRPRPSAADRQPPPASPRMNGHWKVISYVGRIVARHVACSPLLWVIFPWAIFHNFPKTLALLKAHMDEHVIAMNVSRLVWILDKSVLIVSILMCIGNYTEPKIAVRWCIIKIQAKLQMSNETARNRYRWAYEQT